MNGVPVSRVTMEFSCQPPIRRLATPPLFRMAPPTPIGKFEMALATKRWRTSKGELLRSRL